MALAVPSTEPSALTLQVKWELFLKALQDPTAAASNTDCIRKSPPGQCGVNNFGHALVLGDVHSAFYQKSLGQEALCASALLIPESRHSGLMPFPWQPAQQKGRAGLFFSSGKDTLPNKFWVMINLGCKYFSLSWEELPPSSKAPGARAIGTSSGSPISQLPQECIEQSARAIGGTGQERLFLPAGYCRIKSHI